MASGAVVAFCELNAHSNTLKTSETVVFETHKSKAKGWNKQN
jgi:hypothetical protein